MIINGEEVKQKLLQGIDLVANTVKPTLGPQAKTVILQGKHKKGVAMEPLPLVFWLKQFVIELWIH